MRKAFCDLIVICAIIIAAIAGYSVGASTKESATPPEQARAAALGQLPQPVDWILYEGEGLVCILATEPPLAGCGGDVSEAALAARTALLGTPERRLAKTWSVR